MPLPDEREKTILHRLADSDGKHIGWMIFCPACRCGHAFNTEVPNSLGAQWQFNGDIEKPTFSPSMLVKSGHHVPGWKGPECWCVYNREHPNEPAPFTCDICHSFVEKGQIRFLGDCTHKLAGQTVPLEAF